MIPFKTYLAKMHDNTILCNVIGTQKIPFTITDIAFLQQIVDNKAKEYPTAYAYIAACLRGRIQASRDSVDRSYDRLKSAGLIKEDNWGISLTFNLLPTQIHLVKAVESLLRSETEKQFLNRLRLHVDKVQKTMFPDLTSVITVFARLFNLTPVEIENLLKGIAPAPEKPPKTLPLAKVKEKAKPKAKSKAPLFLKSVKPTHALYKTLN